MTKGMRTDIYLTSYNRTYMKKQNNTSILRSIIVLLLVMLPISTLAQAGLAVKEIFDTYGHQKGCKMVNMTHTELCGHKLDVYKSISFKHSATDIRQRLQTDRKQAKKVQEVVEDGEIRSGYYMMPPLTNGTNRYILFHFDAPKGVVIYIEGRLKPKDILQIITIR